jgi:hypothetical protein
MKELSDDDIQRQFKNQHLFRGVVNKDSLVKLNGQAWVFNLDKKTGPGTHWVCASDIDHLYVYYCDSFGEPAPNHITQMMKATGKRIIENEKQLQSMDSSSCGEFCIMMIKELLKRRKPYEIIKGFTNDVNINEKILERYFRHHPMI